MNQSKLIYAAFFLYYLLGAMLSAQVNIEWTNTYNPASNHSQSAYDVAVGDDGASYVLGYNGRGYNGTDVAMIKYSSSGELKWARSYDGGNENNSDIGKSVATYKNSSGVFIYAACDISISGYGNQAGLLKYDSSGNLLWNKNIASGFNSKVTKLILDNSGNAYLAGGTSAEAFIIKFNSNGDTLWMRKLPNPSGYLNGSANDITVDSAGNIYATGKFNYPNVSGDDIVTFKYNSSGVLQWSRIYNYSNFNDFGNAVSVKSAFVYITGGSQSVNGQYDIVTVKYNASTGDSVWVKRYDGASNSQDIAHDIEVDASNNVYVTGHTDGWLSQGNAVTIKYNSSGVIQWTRSYGNNNGNICKEIALDSLGNIYAAGRKEFGAFAQFLCIKYNSNGDSLWTRLHNSGTSEDVFGISFDKNNNIVITGECDNIDMSTLKFNSSGQLQWERKFYGAQLIADYTNSIVTDKNGNVYAAGKSRVSQYGDQFTVIKYNSGGVQKWIHSYGVQLFDNYDEAKAITIDASGFIIVTGTTYSRFSGTTDIFTVKFDSSGNQLWYALYNTSASFNEDARAIETDNFGNIYITGNIQGTGNNYNYLTIRYNSTGSFAWASIYNGPVNGADFAYDIEIDNGGNVYVTGQSAGIGTGDDIATVKYNALGDQQWVQRFNGSANGGDLGNKIEVDKGGNVYVCGMAQEITTGYNSILIKYTSSGSLRWSKQDSSNDSLLAVETARSIKLDTSKTRIYLAGHWSSELSNGRKATFIAKYDSAGNRIHRSDVLYFYLNSETLLNSMTLDVNENMYLAGQRNYFSGESEIVFTAYDSSGFPLHTEPTGYRHPGASFGPNSKEIITVNDNGDVYIGGGMYDSTAGTLMTVIKYRSPKCRITTNLLIQGFYDENSNTMTKDTCNFYLRSASSPFILIDSAKEFPYYSGTYKYAFENANFLTDYYLVVKHRNSIETWSSSFVSFPVSGTVHYDFTYSASRAYGNNQVQVDYYPLIQYAIYSGDVNQDGIVNLSDLILTYNASSLFSSGYDETDVTGDNVSDLTDLMLIYNNSSIFVERSIP